MEKTRMNTEITIPAGPVSLGATLDIPERASGMVVFAHGSGSSRFSPRNTYVAGILRKEGMGTLLFDLLTEQEDASYENRFNLDLLSQRLIMATEWLKTRSEARGLKVGLFGASTGAAAALIAAATPGTGIAAVVSRGGRPDMASQVLPEVKAPTLLIVGGHDKVVLSMNQQAYAQLGGEKDLAVVPGASHLFEEPGKLEEVAALAAQWFKRYLTGGQR
ncbi:MAG: dienelactone hydrolase family protein [bacterium]